MNKYKAKAIILKAINKLKPNAEFSFSDDDYLTVKWDKLDGTAPTQAAINALRAPTAESPEPTTTTFTNNY